MKTLIIVITAIFLMQNAFSQKNNYKLYEKNTLEGTKYGIINIKLDTLVIPSIYDKIDEYSQGKFVVKKGDKYGMLDTTNTIIIPVKYAFVSDVFIDRIFLSEDGEKIGIADQNGKILTKLEFDDVLGYSSGVIRVTKNSKIGYLNSDGTQLLPCKFEEGLNCMGSFIITYTTSWESLGYEYVSYDSNGKVINSKDIGMNVKIPIVFDKTGKILYRGEADEIIKVSPTLEFVFGDKYISGNYNRKYTIIKSTGIVLEPLYFRKLEIEDYWLRITTSDDNGWRYGIMNFSGEIVLKPNFKEISNYIFNDDLLAKIILPNGYFFYVDKDVNCVEFNNQNCPD